MTMLLLAQQIPGSPDFKIFHGNLEPASQIGKFPDGRQPFLCHFFQHLISAVHQERIGCPVGTSNPSSQLIQLG